MAPALISCSTMSVWPLLAAIPRGTCWSTTFGGWEVERMQLWLNEITALRKSYGINIILTKVLVILSQEERQVNWFSMNW